MGSKGGTGPDQLRRRAEEQWSQRPHAEVTDTERLVHELEVHQIELELQNEELISARAELEAGLQRYTELFDFAPIGYLAVSADGTIRELNLAAAALLGAERQRLVGRRLALFAPPGRRWELAELLHHVAESQPEGEPGSRVRELALEPTGGGLREVRITAAVLRRVPCTLLLAVEDVTERRRAQDRETLLTRRFEALDRLAATLSDALRDSGGALLPDDVLRSALEIVRTTCNAQFAALGLGEATGRPIERWLFCGPGPGVFERFRVASLADQVASSQRPLRSSEYVAVPLGIAGRPMGLLFLTTAPGISPTLEDEQVAQLFAQRLSSKLELARLGGELRLAVGARENLLAVVSHDLRSPLAAIRLNTDLLLRAWKTPVDRRKSRKQVEVILRSAERMNRLIDDLLDAATIEAGTFSIDANSEPLAPLVEQLIGSLEAAAAAASVTLRYEVEALPLVRCDRLRIVQVLSNLVENALKFSPAGGEVTVAAMAEGERVRVSVRDDGPGVTAEARPQLFDRYWKGKAKGRHGLGLGLYIAKGIIEAHGGDIGVENRPSGGAVFVFTLPVVAQPNDAIH